MVVLATVPRGLGEPMVERPQSPARDMRQDAVEDHLARLIGVEARVDELAQEPARLRHPEPDGPGEGRSRRIARMEGVAVPAPGFQRGDEVANRGETAAVDQRAFGVVGQFVERAGFPGGACFHFDQRQQRAGDFSHMEFKRPFRQSSARGA